MAPDLGALNEQVLCKQAKYFGLKLLLVDKRRLKETKAHAS
jgi:hypothetical protein